MKPGVISFEILDRAVRLGYRPEARVFLQTLRDDGLADNHVTELKGWTHISIDRTLNTGGRANINFANVNDRYFSNYGERVYSRESETSTRLYLANTMKEALKYTKEINPARRYGSTRNFQGMRELASPQQLADYINYIYSFTGIVKRKSKPLPNADLVDMGLIQRVFIDIKGQDGLWYAGFSGVVSAINDVWQAGGVPTLTLQCRDAWRIFAMSEINLQVGPGAIEDTILFDVQNKLSDFNGLGVSSILDNLDGVDIIQRVMTFSQASISYNAYNLLARQQRILRTGTAAADVAVSQTTFGLQNSLASSIAAAASVGAKVDVPNVSQIFNRESFFLDREIWEMNSVTGMVAENPYAGLSTLRRVVGQEDGLGIPEAGTDVANLVGRLLVDGNIRTGSTGYVYQRLIRRVLAPYQTQKVVGDALVKKVADSSFFDVFCNGNGDVVYQIPRYNNCPGQFSIITSDVNSQSNQVDSETTEDVTTTPEALTSELLDYGKFTEGEYDYAPPPHNFAVKWHGQNYIITNLGLRSWNFNLSEEPIVSVVRLPGGAELIQDVGAIAPVLLVGNTHLQDNCGIPLGTVADIQRRFGIRVREAQQIFIPGIFGSDHNSKPLLDAMALAIMQQINATASTGTIQLSSRPDLDVGANVLAVERQRLLYVISWNYTITQGKDAVTQLSLSYGHDIGTSVPSPFLALREQLLKIERTPDTLPAQAETAAAPTVTTTSGPDGQVTTVTIPKVVGGTFVIPSGREAVERTYGSFSWVEDPSLPGGYVRVTDNFHKDWIVNRTVQVTDKIPADISVHKYALPFFLAVFNRLRRMPELRNKKIEVIQTYRARKVWNNPKEKRLSFHSWGIAIDIAVGDYKRVSGQAICPANAIIAPVFQEFGFFWGGGPNGFRQTDDIHFQLALPEGRREFTVNVPTGEAE